MELTPVSRQATQQAERADFKLRGPIITGILRNKLANTAYTKNESFSGDDLEKAKEAFIEAARFVSNKVYPDFWEHCLYSSIMARVITEIIKSEDLTPEEAEAVAFMGDSGSLAIPHAYYRKNVVNGLFDGNIGIRAELLSKQPPIARILGRGEAIHSISDMNLPQIVLDVADNLGKIESDGQPRTIEQAISYARRQPQTYQEAIFPSTKWGLKALTLGQRQEFAIRLLIDEIEYLKANFGVDMEKVMETSFAEYSLPENQGWLRKAKQAQETLDPQVDTVLGRTGVKTIAFDFGGVLVEDGDIAFENALATTLGCSFDAVKTAFEELNPDSFANKISEEEYLRKFYQRVGVNFPISLEKARSPFKQPSFGRIRSQMQELVTRLTQKGINLFVLSNAIHSVTTTNLSFLRQHFPEIPADHLLVSNQVNAAKGESGNLIFRILLDRAGNPDPLSVLFVDDKVAHTTAARARYNLRAMHFTDNDPTRIIQELARGQYI